MKKQLIAECKRCAVRIKHKCVGQYQAIERDGLPSIEPLLPSDAVEEYCPQNLVSVTNGEVFINYDCEYSIGLLNRLTKKKFTEFLIHLSEKDWFSMFILRIVIVRVFELKKWKDRHLTFDLSSMIPRDKM